MQHQYFRTGIRRLASDTDDFDNGCCKKRVEFPARSNFEDFCQTSVLSGNRQSRSRKHVQHKLEKYLEHEDK